MVYLAGMGLRGSLHGRSEGCGEDCGKCWNVGMDIWYDVATPV